MAKKRASPQRPPGRRTKGDAPAPNTARTAPTAPTAAADPWEAEETQVVPTATLSTLRRESVRPDEAPPPSSEQSATSGVATRGGRGGGARGDRGLNRLRELYAKGDVKGAMALAEELARERIDQDPRRQGAPSQLSGDSPDASIQVEYGPDVSIEVDVSLSGLDSNKGLTVKMPLPGYKKGQGDGADAPDASVCLEYGEVDVSLTGLEPFAHDAVDISISSLSGISADEAPTDLSLQGLTGIIGAIESSEPTLDFRRPLSKQALLMRQRLLAEKLGAVAPLVSMPVEDSQAPLPEVLTSEVPFPHTPGMAGRIQQLQDEALEREQQALQIKDIFLKAQQTLQTNKVFGETEQALQIKAAFHAQQSRPAPTTPTQTSPPPTPTGPPQSQSQLTLSQRQSIPHLIIAASEISSLPIDPRGGFLLGQIDGVQTVDEILDVCAMPADVALDLLRQLASLGVIRFE